MSKMWGGRFSKKTNPLIEKFTSSIDVDKRLAEFDCMASIAHARMLAKCSIIPKKDAVKIISGLNAILAEIKNGVFKYDKSEEDIHTVLQDGLDKKIGKSSKLLHTARSRNDQVALDERMYCKKEIDVCMGLLADLKKSIKGFAVKYKDVIIPGLTHLQNAQPVLLGHHMLAYCEMLQRDMDRLKDCRKRTDIMPLGSCAICGTSLAIDRNFVAKELGFSKVSSNSMDAVSDRDFIIEFIFCLSLTAMHLSRMAEDLVIWNSQPFGIIEIEDDFCTGSSMMPQKKNPDVLELVRGGCGLLYGGLIEAMTIMKALPLTYNRDMQLDKPPLFRAVDGIKDSLGVLILLFDSIKMHKERIKELLKDESLYATDIMEYLVKKGVTLKDSHDIVGRIITYCLDKKLNISDIPLKDLRCFCPKFGKDIYGFLNPEKSVSLKNSFGGTNPIQVRTQLGHA